MSTINTFTDESMRRIAREIFQAEREAMSARILQQVMRFSGGGEIARAGDERVQVVNMTTETIPRYGVMRVYNAVLRAGRIAYEVAKPDGTPQAIYLVNESSPIAADGIGYASWRHDPGRVLCNATVDSPAAGETWGPESGQWWLKKGEPGFTLVGGQEGTGEEATVKAFQPHGRTLIGKPDETISANSAGTIKVYSGVDRTDTGATLEAYTIIELEEDKWVTVEMVDGVFYAFKWEC
jgi:hypothetical protein